MGLRRLLSFRRSSRKEQPPSSPDAHQPPSWSCFSYDDLLRATGGFHHGNLVGRGGFAEVYRGVLADGTPVAVKRLTAAADERGAEEFLRELGTVGHASHANVCRLVGCCVESGLHLVFVLSSNGSVSSHLHGFYEVGLADDERMEVLPWEVRYRVAEGTARGLDYLHNRCRRRIIHRDIKASNILLTADFQPQISDFGLAKWLPKDWTHRAVAPIEGTFGYLAPEYFMHGIVDEKTDVFAFGVFLLELISGKKPVDGSHQSLLSWAKPYLNHGNIEKLVDPRLKCDYDLLQLNRLTFVASVCIRDMATYRPSMDEVLGLIIGDYGKEIPEFWQMTTLEQKEEQFLGFEDLELEDLDTTTSLSSVSSTPSS